MRRFSNSIIVTEIERKSIEYWALMAPSFASFMGAMFGMALGGLLMGIEPKGSLYVLATVSGLGTIGFPALNFRAVRSIFERIDSETVRHEEEGEPL